MSNTLTTISLEHIEDKTLIEEFLDAFEDIPFENSEFQTRAFVIAAQQTPARAYRAIGLQMHSKIEAIKHNLLKRERTKIDIEEKELKIADENTSEFDRRRLRLDIMEIQDSEKYGAKLMKDALTTLNILYDEFKKLPRYTRAQFEAEERKHFALRLDRQNKFPGAHESLQNMLVDLPQWEARIDESRLQIESFADFKKKLAVV